VAYGISGSTPRWRSINRLLLGKVNATASASNIRATAASLQSTHIDTRGLLCPLPVLKARRALNTLQSGQCLRVIATDSKAPGDFAAFCEQSGHLLVEASQDGERFCIVVQKH
jgi:TusA-related sulfurtransferase